MNYQQFLAELRKTPRDWQLKFDREIRRAGNYQCPISTLRDKDEGDYFLVAQDLGLPNSIARRIADAADGVTYGKYRRDLLAACGLKE